MSLNGELDVFRAVFTAKASPEVREGMACTDIELAASSILQRALKACQRIPLAGVAHQNGTIRFGIDLRTSALDVNCKAHDADNLYVVDARFFPSSGAVHPALTIMANALRVGDHLRERLG